jgi:hypothetical protein
VRFRASTRRCRDRDDWWTAALAAQLAVPQAAWPYETAGYAWGLVRSAPARFDLIVPEFRRIAAPSGVVVHRVTDADRHVDNLHWPWRTTPEETILDLALSATPDELFALLGRAFQKRLTDESSVLRRLEGRLRHPRRALLKRSCRRQTRGSRAPSRAATCTTWNGHTGCRSEYGSGVDRGTDGNATTSAIRTNMFSSSWTAGSVMRAFRLRFASDVATVGVPDRVGLPYVRTGPTWP